MKGVFLFLDVLAVSFVYPAQAITIPCNENPRRP